MIKLKLSIILPAKNEAESLEALLPKLKQHYPDSEIIVVNDGSDDATSSVIEKNNILSVTHPYSKGNGASIKSGARIASGDILVFMDADSQHDVDDVSSLVDRIRDGYDMVVGSRDGAGQANMARGFANSFYNRFASFITGHKIVDLTSGFRVVKAEKFRQFLHLLPNGFSYPSTITMAFFRAGYTVAYVPVNVSQRVGKSHIRPLKDGIRFLLIIFRVATLYSPLKIFFPLSTLVFLLGFAYYGYTYFSDGRFTNMGAVFMLSGVTIFLIGLVSEQITMLIYKDADK